MNKTDKFSTESASPVRVRYAVPGMTLGSLLKGLGIEEDAQPYFLKLDGAVIRAQDLEDGWDEALPDGALVVLAPQGARMAKVTNLAYAPALRKIAVQMAGMAGTPSLADKFFDLMQSEMPGLPPPTVSDRQRRAPIAPYVFVQGGLLRDDYRAWIAEPGQPRPARAQTIRRVQAEGIPFYRLQNGSAPRDVFLPFNGNAALRIIHFSVPGGYDGAGQRRLAIYAARSNLDAGEEPTCEQVRENDTLVGQLVVSEHGRLLAPPIFIPAGQIVMTRPEPSDENGEIISALDRAKGEIIQKLGLVALAGVHGRVYSQYAVPSDPLLATSALRPDAYLPDQRLIVDIKRGFMLSDIVNTIIKYCALKRIHPRLSDGPIIIYVFDKEAIGDVDIEGLVRGVDYEIRSIDELLTASNGDTPALVAATTEIREALSAEVGDQDKIDRLGAVKGRIEVLYTQRQAQGLIVDGESFAKAVIGRVDVLETCARQRPEELTQLLRATAGYLREHQDTRPFYTQAQLARLSANMDRLAAIRDPQDPDLASVRRLVSEAIPPEQAVPDQGVARIARLSSAVSVTSAAPILAEESIVLQPSVTAIVHDRVAEQAAVVEVSNTAVPATPTESAVTTAVRKPIEFLLNGLDTQSSAYNRVFETARTPEALEKVLAGPLARRVAAAAGKSRARVTVRVVPATPEQQRLWDAVVAREQTGFAVVSNFESDLTDRIIEGSFELAQVFDRDG
ncbi:MAG: hypothetical protein WCG06_03925, partial [Candidatus Omnitrophota bacterium]